MAIIKKKYILSRNLITSLDITGTFSTLNITHKCRNSLDSLYSEDPEEQAAEGRLVKIQH